MAEQQVDTPARRRNRWLAAAAVALCYGLSVFFVTGDAGKGASIALLVMAIFAALLLLLPRRLTSDKPLSAYYGAGLAVLIGPFLILGLGQTRTPWDDLEERYRATAPAPAGLDAGEEIVLLQPVDEVMVKPFAFKRATTSFDDGGVYLSLSWPLSMIYDPLWLPVDAIATCRTSGLDTMYTNLTLAAVAAQVEVLDAPEAVLEWCRERGIAGQERTPGLLR